MGSINTDSTTINFNGANIKIATSGKGLIFADGTTLSSNTEIGGGGSSNLQQVVDLGNVTSNTLLLENTGKTIVSSGNIESNIITTIIRFQEGSELPDGQGITLESAANNGNTISNVVQFSNGFTVGSNLVVDEIGTNVIDVTGRIGATLFVGDGGLLSNISGGGGSQTLQQTTDLGNTTTNVVTFTNGLVASSVTELEDLTVSNDANVVRQIKTTRINYYDKATKAWAYFDNRAYLGGDEIHFMNKAASDTVMFIDTATPNVGIGTTSPSANLHVVGDIHSTTGITSNGTIETLNSSGTEGIILRESGTIELCKTNGEAYIDFKNSYGDDWDFKIQAGGSSRALQFKPYGGIYTTIASTGYVGIGQNNPLTTLHLKQPSSDQYSDITNYNQAVLIMERNGSSTHKWAFSIDWSSRLNLTFNMNCKVVINDAGVDDTYLNFTGQHRCFNEFSNVSNLVGMIVCSKSNKYVNFDFTQSPTINECLPVISLSNVACDKSCFGVISGKEEAGNRTTSSGTVMSVLPQESGDNRVFVNSLGEGAIWVSNLNGNLESGDYITTSNISGYGQKQDSEFLANYTVAKITMDCDFNPHMVPNRIIQKDADGKNVLDSNGNLILEDSSEMISQYEVKTLTDGTKVAFVGCTYHCG